MENLPTYRLTQSGPEAQEILDQVNLNTVDIEQLKRLYQALTQSEPEIIEPTDTWPVANPEENVIYRVIDRVNTPPQYYSDYMWNGTSMVLMGQYNNAIDNEPTANSNNLVKSGGVYSFVHANGGAYDISAAHAVGGVLATYDDLADALGTNGANVPAAVRKGGMSIKFVLSSDNKYVRFNYLLSDVTTASTFANVANWQGVDDEPTHGSQNLVKSGGVFDIGFVQKKLTAIQTYSHSALALNGSLSQLYVDGNLDVNVYECQEGEKFRLLGEWVGYNRCCYCLYNSSTISAENCVVTGIHPNNTTPSNPYHVDIDITIPSGVTHIAISRYMGNGLVGNRLDLYKYEAVNQYSLLDIDLFDNTAEQAQTSSFNIGVKKKNSSDILDNLTIPEVSDNRAGLVGAKNSWDNEPIYGSSKILKSGGIAFAKIIQSNYKETGHDVVANTQYVDFGTLSCTNKSGYFAIYGKCTDGSVEKFSVAGSDWAGYLQNKDVNVWHIYDVSNLPNTITSLRPILYANQVLSNGHIDFAMLTIPNSNILNLFLKKLYEDDEHLSTLDTTISALDTRLFNLENLESEVLCTAIQTYSHSALALDGSLSQDSADGSLDVNVYECQEGDKFRLVGDWVGYNRRWYCLYNSSTISAENCVVKGTYENCTTSTNPLHVDRDIVIPAGVTHIAVSRYIGNSYYHGVPFDLYKYVYTSIVEEVENLQEQIENIENSDFSIKIESNKVRVTRSYAASVPTTLGVEIAKVGPNSLMQLSKMIYTTSGGTTEKGYSSDWIGPYNMTADQNGNGNSGFTGGWHGYNGDQTGSATARTASFRVEIDNNVVSELGDYNGNRVKVIVDNYIQAGNTKESDGSGREVLHEKVTYTFEGNNVFVEVKSKALEDIHISTYYGMQINQYANKYTFIGENIEESPSDGRTSYYHSGDTRIVVGEFADKKAVAASMNRLDLGTFRVLPANTATAFCMGYGSSGYSKAYYNLIKDVSHAVAEGGLIYWSGKYEFFENN